MNQLFRTLIFVSGAELELHPRVHKVAEAMGRALSIEFLHQHYRWEVHEITQWGDSKVRLAGEVNPVLGTSRRIEV